MHSCVLRSLWKYFKPSKFITRVYNNMLSLNDAPNYCTWFYFWWMRDGAAQRGTLGYCVVHQLCLMCTRGRVRDVPVAEKRLCADYPHANMFPRTAASWPVIQTQRSMPVRSAWAIGVSDNKVKLSSASTSAFERSSVSDVQRMCTQNGNSIWKHRRTETCF